MLKRQFVVWLVSVFSISLILVPTQAQRPREFRVIAYPTRSYHLTKDWRDKGPLKDYVVEFDTEMDSHAHLVSSSDARASEVLRNSTIDASECRNGKRIVKVIAGFQARTFNRYTGSLQDFARTLKMQYLTRTGPRG
jgi:hypothetical protein